MRHWGVFVALVLLSVFGLAVFAAEKPPENYQKAMKDLGALSQGIGKAVADENYDAITEYATSAKAAFVVVEEFWRTKGGEALKMAQTGGKAASDLEVTAGLKNAEGVAFAAKELTDLCAGCHAAHREKMPDGTFQIK